MSSLLSGIRFVSKTEEKPASRSGGDTHDKRKEETAGHKRHRHEYEEDRHKKHHKHKKHHHHKHERKEKRHRKEREASRSPSPSPSESRRRSRSASSSEYSDSSLEGDRHGEDADPREVAEPKQNWMNPALEKRLQGHSSSGGAERASTDVQKELSNIKATARMDWMSTVPDRPAVAAANSERILPETRQKPEQLSTSLPAGLSFPTKADADAPIQHNAQKSDGPIAPAADVRSRMLRPAIEETHTPTSIDSNASDWKKRIQARKQLVTGPPSKFADILQGVDAATTTAASITPEIRETWPHTNTTSQPRAANSSVPEQVTTTPAETASNSQSADLPKPNLETVTLDAAAAPVPTEEDLNKLHARALRAQMMGDSAKFDALQKQIALIQEQLRHGKALEAAAVAMETAPASRRPSAVVDHARPATLLQASSDSAGANVQVISAFDKYGVPIASLQSGKQAPIESDDLRSGRRQGKHKPANTIGPTGERQAILQEDLKDVSVADLVREEMRTSAGAFDERIATNILRAGTQFRGAGLSGSKSGVDEGTADATDDMAKLVEDPDAKLTARAKQDKDMQRAVAAHESMNKAISSCRYCFDGAGMKKHLIIALGEHSLLMLPPDGEKLPGHCLIVPMAHIAAMTEAEEEVYDEVNKFKAALFAMHQANDEDVLFLETAMHFGRRKHTVIDVVPMEKEVAMDAPLYFRKEMVDAEEWTSNKTLIDTAGKGLRRCIPKGFPYFHVGWQGGGFVHPIEEEGEFPPNFGIDVCAGMQGLPPGAWDRRGGKHRTFEQERQAVMEFLKKWQPFDWTQGLEGTSA